jgi:hypothetical protein
MGSYFIINDQKIISCITTLLDLTPKIAPLRPHNSNKATDLSLLLCPSSVCCSVPIAVSQTLTVLSSDADASSFELCKKATDLSLLLCPLSVCCSVPVAVSQTLTVLLYDADASSFELCKKATDLT